MRPSRNRRSVLRAGRRSAAPTSLALVLLTLAAGSAHADIELSYDFDSGALDPARSSATDDLVTYHGRDNFYGGNRWRWVYFKASGVLGKRPTFRTSDNFAGGGSALDQHRMVYSYDNQNWFFFDNNVRTAARNQYTSGNNEPFTRDEVYVAYSYPYPYQRAADHVATMRQSPYVMPTASSDQNLVIGQSPGGVDDLGRTVAPLDMWGYRLTDPSIDDPKTRIVLTGGLHAGETLGSHTLEAMLDFLASDDPRAALVRRQGDFYVYPLLNPDGRFAGNNRATIANPNQDPNCCWSDHPFQSNWLARNKADLRLSGEAMLADLSDPDAGHPDADYFIDFHSTIPTPLRQDFGFLHPEFGHLDDPFWQYLTDLDPRIQWVQSTSTGPTTANFGERDLHAEFDLTFETMFLPDRGLDHYRQMGEDFALAFYLAFVDRLGPGDFDGDNDADAFDLGIWQTGFGITSDAERVHGDADGDGDVDAFDLGIWQQAFQGTPIPEPSALAALLLVLAAAPCRRASA